MPIYLNLYCQVLLIKIRSVDGARRNINPISPDQSQMFH